MGVGFPAVVRNGVVHSAANIDESWIDVDADAFFTAAAGVHVHMINDADAAGVAEVRFGAGRGYSGVVMMLTFGTGIGSGLFIDGVLVPNTELGHLELDGVDAESHAAASARKRDDLTWSGWAKRVRDYLRHVERLFSPDLFIVGGGASKQAEQWLPKCRSTPRSSQRRWRTTPASSAPRWSHRPRDRRSEVITVVGEALVDLVVAPDGSVTATLGGAPYNAARAAARLGASTRFAGALSTDRFGTLLAARLDADGVDTRFGRRTARPTTLAAAELDEHGSATYHFYIDGTSAPDLPFGALGELPADPLFFTGGLALALEPMAATVIEHLRELHDDTTVVIDVNARPAVVTDRARYVANLAAAIGRADVVKVSEEDLTFLRGDLSVDDLLAAGARAVVVTAGASATTVHHECGVTSIDVRRPVAPVVDTIGAGDTFVGALMAAWTGGLVTPARSRADLAGPDGFDALLAVVDVAHAAASIVVTRQRADPPTRDELLGTL